MNTRLTLALVGLLVAAVTVVGCGGSNSSMNNPVSPTPTPTPTPGGGATLTITIVGSVDEHSFSPNPSSVMVGQTVAWYNADSIVHTATANNGAFNTGNIAPGATSAPITMTAAGGFDYRCAIHPNMRGTLNVTDPSSGGY